MTDLDRTETDPAVCYRHPGRQSWVLCQRCGRTICPECQILAPVGVQCPECVREAGGSVKWTPTGSGARASAARSMRRSNSPAWLRSFGRMLRPDGGAPVVSWGLAAAAVLIWIVGFFSTIPFALLYADPTHALQVWRLATGIVAYPPGIGGLLSLALGIVFWMLNAPGAERSMGRPRFLAIVLAAGIAGNAAQYLVGGPGYGLFGALFGIFAAYLIEMWGVPSARFQILVMFAINLMLMVFLGGGAFLAEVVIGSIYGAGAFYALNRLGDRVRLGARTPYLIIAGAVLLIAIVGVLRSLAG